MKNLKVSGIMLYLLGLVLVLLLYFYLIFLPMSARVAQLNLQHEQNTAKLQLYQKELLQADQLNESINTLQAELDKLKSTTSISGKNAADDLGKAMNDTGVVPIQLQIGNETVDKSKTSGTGEPVCSVPISLQVNCSQEQLQQLLDYFETKSQGAYYVNSVNYAGGQVTAPADLSLTLYYFGNGETKK